MPGTDLVKRSAYPPVPVAAKRQSEALVPAAFRRARRDRHVSVPLAVPPVMWITGEVLHACAVAPETAVASIAIGGAVWFFAPHKWDRPAEQWYARLSAAGTGAYLSLAAWLGASSGLPGEILGGTLVAGGAAWGIPWWRHHRPRGRRRREKMLARWQAWWEIHCHDWNLAGSRVIDAAEQGVTVRLRIQLWAGRQSVQNMQQVVHLIESGLQGMAEAGRVRVEVVRSDPSQVDVFIKRENPLREPVAWDAALAPASVHDDWTPGVTETGAQRHMRQRASSFVIGATRTGKSNRLLVRVLCLAGCPDALTVLIDLKGGRSARPVLASQAADYVITDVSEARLWLRLACEEIEARAKNCYTGTEQLEATEEVPAVFTVIDETHGLTSIPKGNTQCANDLSTLASQGAGLEFYADVYTQHGSLESSVRTEQTRMNLPVRVVYRVEHPSHAAFAIPEYNKLDASKLEEQGTCYAKDGPRTRPEQVRDVYMPHDLFAREAPAAVRCAGKPREWILYAGGRPCPAGGTWQQWWNTRWLRLDPAFHDISPQYQEAAAKAAAGKAAAASVLPEAGVTVGPARTVTVTPSPAASGRSEGAEVAARIDAEASAPEDFTPSRKAVSRLGAVMREQKEAWASALASAVAGITANQLSAKSGMRRTWTYDTLKALAGAGVVIQPERGLWAPVPGADIEAAVDAVEAGNELLLRQARRQVRRAVS